MDDGVQFDERQNIVARGIVREKPSITRWLLKTGIVRSRVSAQIALFAASIVLFICALGIYIVSRPNSVSERQLQEAQEQMMREMSTPSLSPVR